MSVYRRRDGTPIVVSRRVLLRAIPALPLLRFAPASAEAPTVDSADAAAAEATDVKIPPSYALEVRVEPAKKYLEVSGTLSIGAASETRRQLRFALGNSFAANFKIEIVSPKSLAGPFTFGPKEVFGTVKAWNLFDTIAAWNVTPRSPIPAGTPLVLVFSYSGSAEPADVFQLAPEGSFANGSTFPWYPQILFPVIGNQPEVGVVRYRFIGAETFQSAGIETTTAEDKSNGFRRFETRHASNFGFAAGHYHVQHGESGLPLSTYLLTERPHIQRALPRVNRQMALLQQWYGPYPQGELKIVECPTPTERQFGSSLDSIIFVTSGILDRAWDDTFYGHEISHAWFGEKFAVDRYVASEGMANYAALQLVEAIYGPEAAKQFRLYGRPGYVADQCALGYFQIAVAGYDVPLDRQPDNYAQTQVNYSKGMLVLDMLKRHVGVSRFNAIIRNFMEAHPFQAQPWDIFQAAVSRGAGEDLSWFFEQWFSRTGAPDLGLDWKEKQGHLAITIRQQGDPYRLDVPAVIQLADGQRLSKVFKVRRSEETFRVPLGGRALSVELDPEYTILRWTAELKAIAKAMLSWTKAMMESTYAAGIELVKQEIETPPSPDPYGVTFMLRYGLGVLYEKDKQWSASAAAYRAAWSEPRKREDITPWALISLARAAHTAGDQASERWALESALEVARRMPPSMMEEEARLELEHLAK
jgi:hypothetical protein